MFTLVRVHDKVAVYMSHEDSSVWFVYQLIPIDFVIPKHLRASCDNMPVLSVKHNNY